MKKALAFLSMLAMVVMLTACGGLTHCKDCDDEIYKDGYCQYHYNLHKADDAVKGLFDKLTGE